jgi:3-hydroxy-9,10-secoandrosta-1,3,5(10)-triene-9,17-dione monooxygenase reductase component
VELRGPTAGRPIEGMSHLGRDPFETPPEQRDPARRLRGRLAAPVTVWTTTRQSRHVGLTVSSLLVVEGEPATLVGLIGPLTDLWSAVQESKRFVVHVLGDRDGPTAERFTGRDPGDPFDGIAVRETPWGPVIDSLSTVAFCDLSGFLEIGYSVLVRAHLSETALEPRERPPLVYYRGRYRSLRPE